jgi:hypothetical protein
MNFSFGDSVFHIGWIDGIFYLIMACWILSIPSIFIILVLLMWGYQRKKVIGEIKE